MKQEYKPAKERHSEGIHQHPIFRNGQAHTPLTNNRQYELHDKNPYNADLCLNLKIRKRKWRLCMRNQHPSFAI